MLNPSENRSYNEDSNSTYNSSHNSNGNNRDSFHNPNNRITKTQALTALLPHITHADLAQLYASEMEVQVTVRKGDGVQVQQEFKGRPYIAYTNDRETWKPFRIPWKASTKPEYIDTPMQYDLAEYYEGIGMTGWNWKQQKSIYVAYDFDSIANHEQGLSEEELKHICDLAAEVPWVTIRRSTSGSGYHLYVFVDGVPTQTHTEHAALSRAILAKLSSIVGFDFAAQVDTCGGNMWIAHRKMEYDGEDTVGLSLVKQGEILYDVPINWKSHVDVVARRKHRVALPVEVQEKDEIEDLINQRIRIPLDSEHKSLILELDGTDSWWDPDRHLLVTHTWTLAQIHQKGGYRGVFKTTATGSAEGGDHNCFCLPVSEGGWLVYRYTKFCTEDPSWAQTTTGWTSCYFNRDPDLKTAARAFQAIETEKRGFLFQDALTIQKALEVIGVYTDLPNFVLSRESLFREGKDGRVVVKVKREDRDDAGKMPGWEPSKDGYWTRIFQATKKAQSETTINLYEDLIRHLVQGSEDHGWAINNEGTWCSEPLIHVKLALAAQGFNEFEIKGVTGGNITHCWHVICKPFQPEYPGGRAWNRGAPQLLHVPTSDTDNLSYPNWLRILNHCGQSLNESVRTDSWCMANGLTTGADYLKCWCASLLQHPNQPLPYLFFFGEQNTGKSVFHEALSLLFAPGYVRADVALSHPSGFNGELENAILCVVEETNLRANKTAYNRIKDWVTSLMLPLHRKTRTPTLIPNTTHWVQCANDPSFCPIFPGDTRIVPIKVPTLEEIIPRRELFKKLVEEAPDFVAELLSIQIPRSHDRLNIPIVRTPEKELLEDANKSEVEMFLSENCYYVPGVMTPFADVYNRFLMHVQESGGEMISKIKFGKEMPLDIYPKGRRQDAIWCFGNLSFEKRVSTDRKLIRSSTSDFLMEEPI